MAVALDVLDAAGIDVGSWLGRRWDTLGAVPVAYLIAAVALVTVRIAYTARCRLVILRTGYTPGSGSRQSWRPMQSGADVSSRGRWFELSTAHLAWIRAHGVRERARDGISRRRSDSRTKSYCARTSC